jgi:hypothetical protein
MEMFREIPIVNSHNTSSLSHYNLAMESLRYYNKSVRSGEYISKMIHANEILFQMRKSINAGIREIHRKHCYER